MRRENKTIQGLALAIVVLLWILSFPAVGKNSPQTLKIGAAAPDFNLPGVDGRNYTLEEFSDANIMVVVFTCNHCPTAQAYEDRIKKLAEDYKDKGVVLVAISPNDPKAVRLDELRYSDMNDSLREMKIRAKDKGFEFAYLYDGDKQEVSREYGPVSTPHVFIFDKERKLRYAGRIDNSQKIEHATISDAHNAIEALLAGEDVAVEKTPAFGCSVKWSDKVQTVKETAKKWQNEKVDLKIIDKAGMKKLLKNDKGKLLLINFWASWCGPCIVELPELVDINRMYRLRDFEVVTVSLDFLEKEKTALRILEKSNASFTNYIFNSPDVYGLMHMVDKSWSGAIPYTLLVEPGGKVIYRRDGMINPLELKKVIVGYLGRYYE